MWQQEDEFRKRLERAISKGTRSSIDDVTELAVSEEKWVGCEWTMSLSKRTELWETFLTSKILHAVLQKCCLTSGAIYGEGIEKAAHKCVVYNLQRMPTFTVRNGCQRQIW
jgi:hypothetical protein